MREMYNVGSAHAARRSGVDLGLSKWTLHCALHFA